MKEREEKRKGNTAGNPVTESSARSRGGVGEKLLAGNKPRSGKAPPKRDSSTL